MLGIKSLPATGGADRVVERLLLHAAPQTHFWVYMMRTAQPVLHCSGNMHYVYVPSFGGKHLRPFVYFLLCAAHALVKGRYDLAHVHNSDFGLFCPLLRVKRGLRLVGTFHGDPYLRAKWGKVARIYLRLSERCFAQFCHRLTSVSRFKQQAQGLWASRLVEYIPNGMDAPAAPAAVPSVELTALGVRPGEYLLFACGRLDSTKGLHHLLRAYAAAGRGEPLLVIGDFGHDRAYSAMIEAEAARLPGVVLYPRLLAREALMHVVRNCRAFVFPSEVEAMSMMLLEAVSCRAPVICSDIPENLEVVGRGYPFAFSLSRDGDLQAKLDAALQSPELATQAERLFQDVARRFDWQLSQRRYESLYVALTSTGPPAAIRGAPSRST